MKLHSLPIIVLVVLFLMAAAGTWLWWSPTNSGESFRALLNVAANLLLIGVTWEYVLISRATLQHYENQAAERSKSRPAFSLRVDYDTHEKIGDLAGSFKQVPSVYLDAWNLGSSPFKVTRIQFPSSGEMFHIRPDKLVRENEVGSVKVTQALISSVIEHCDWSLSKVTDRDVVINATVTVITGKGPRLESLALPARIRISDDTIGVNVDPVSES
jgi:hypothetical protein